ncbi:MAG: coproporphyrinogen dehydrogenase HemZ, partial [Lachnospiraceae bacterium]|nr:coproporphyrinogen dehydrogenase HemZ [Lachnospiraceae bacterium]
MRLLLSSALFEHDIRGLLMSYFPWTRFQTEEGPEEEDFVQIRFDNESRMAEDGFLSGTIRVKLGTSEREEYFKEDASVIKFCRNRFKRQFVRLMSEMTGRELPWGTLSGVRPVKIPMAMLEEGKSGEEITSYLRDELLLSEKKAALSLEIAERERAIMARACVPGGYSLYIGIPFCPTTCLYCSFTSYPIGRFMKQVPEYLAAVEKELDFVAEHFRGRKLKTVYFGGGTPTTLSAEDLGRLLEDVCTKLDLSGNLEWTVEAGRPDSIDREKLQMLKRYPVSRISINPQTFCQRTLDLIGRRHTVQQVYDAYSLAREIGFDAINMDLILGLPGETEEDIEHTMTEIVRLRPENVTLHSLAIKRSSRLNLMKEQYQGFRMENSEKIMRMSEEALRGIGLQPYYLYRQKNMAGNLENVGYAKPGTEGVY